jgi:hypothetical protein
MVDRHATGSDELPSNDDFEWVNAWAASTARAEPEIETPAAEADSAPSLADVEVLTPALAVEAAAPEEVSPIPATEIATPNVEPLEPQAPAHRVAAVDIDDVTCPLPLVAETPDVSSGARPPRVCGWLVRRPWTRMLRVVARDPDPVAETIHVVEPTAPSDAESAASLVAEQTQALPQPAEAEPAPAPVEPVLALDQLERDIAEIELIRDQLLAEPVEAVARVDSAEARAPKRTSDHVPVLVGGALALTLLVVFGAAASLVSLR